MSDVLSVVIKLGNIFYLRLKQLESNKVAVTALLARVRCLIGSVEALSPVVKELSPNDFVLLNEVRDTLVTAMTISEHLSNTNDWTAIISSFLKASSIADQINELDALISQHLLEVNRIIAVVFAESHLRLKSEMRRLNVIFRSLSRVDARSSSTDITTPEIDSLVIRVATDPLKYTVNNIVKNHTVELLSSDEKPEEFRAEQEVVEKAQRELARTFEISPATGEELLKLLSSKAAALPEIAFSELSFKTSPLSKKNMTSDVKKLICFCQWTSKAKGSKTVDVVFKGYLASSSNLNQDALNELSHEISLLAAAGSDEKSHVLPIFGFVKHVKKKKGLYGFIMPAKCTTVGKLFSVYATKNAGLPPVNIRLSWALALADAVAALHEKHITHGSIHLDNILLDENGSLFLSDFGQSHFQSAINSALSYGSPVCGVDGKCGCPQGCDGVCVGETMRGRLEAKKSSRFRFRSKRAKSSPPSTTTPLPATPTSSVSPSVTFRLPSRESDVASLFLCVDAILRGQGALSASPDFSSAYDGELEGLYAASVNSFSRSTAESVGQVLRRELSSAAANPLSQQQPLLGHTPHAAAARVAQALRMALRPLEPQLASQQLLEAVLGGRSELVPGAALAVLNGKTMQPSGCVPRSKKAQARALRIPDLTPSPAQPLRSRSVVNSPVSVEAPLPTSTALSSELKAQTRQSSFVFTSTHPATTPAPPSVVTTASVPTENVMTTLPALSKSVSSKDLSAAKSKAKVVISTAENGFSRRRMSRGHYDNSNEILSKYLAINPVALASKPVVQNVAVTNVVNDAKAARAVVKRTTSATTTPSNALMSSPKAVLAAPAVAPKSHFIFGNGSLRSKSGENMKQSASDIDSAAQVALSASKSSTPTTNTKVLPAKPAAHTDPLLRNLNTTNISPAIVEFIKAKREGRSVADPEFQKRYREMLKNPSLNPHKAVRNQAEALKKQQEVKQEQEQKRVVVTKAPPKKGYLFKATNELPSSLLISQPSVEEPKAAVVPPAAPVRSRSQPARTYNKWVEHAKEHKKQALVSQETKVKPNVFRSEFSPLDAETKLRLERLRERWSGAAGPSQALMRETAALLSQIPVVSASVSASSPASAASSADSASSTHPHKRVPILPPTKSQSSAVKQVDLMFNGKKINSDPLKARTASLPATAASVPPVAPWNPPAVVERDIVQFPARAYYSDSDDDDDDDNDSIAPASSSNSSAVSARSAHRERSRSMSLDRTYAVYQQDMQPHPLPQKPSLNNGFTFARLLPTSAVPDRTRGRSRVGVMTVKKQPVIIQKSSAQTHNALNSGKRTGDRSSSEVTRTSTGGVSYSSLQSELLPAHSRVTSTKTTYPVLPAPALAPVAAIGTTVAAPNVEKAIAVEASGSAGVSRARSTSTGARGFLGIIKRRSVSEPQAAPKSVRFDDDEAKHTDRPMLVAEVVVSAPIDSSEVSRSLTFLSPEVHSRVESRLDTAVAVHTPSSVNEVPGQKEKEKKKKKGLFAWLRGKSKDSTPPSTPSTPFPATPVPNRANASPSAPVMTPLVPSAASSVSLSSSSSGSTSLGVIAVPVSPDLSSPLTVASAGSAAAAAAVDVLKSLTSEANSLNLSAAPVFGLPPLAPASPAVTTASVEATTTAIVPSTPLPVSTKKPTLVEVGSLVFDPVAAAAAASGVAGFSSSLSVSSSLQITSMLGIPSVRGGPGLVALGCSSGAIFIYNQSSRAVEAQLRGHQSSVSALALLPSSAGHALLLSASTDGTVLGWHDHQFSPSLFAQLHPGGVPRTGFWGATRISFSLTGSKGHATVLTPLSDNVFAVGSSEGELLVFHLFCAQPLVRMKLHADALSSVTCVLAAPPERSSAEIINDFSQPVPGTASTRLSGVQLGTNSRTGNHIFTAAHSVANVTAGGGSTASTDGSTRTTINLTGSNQDSPSSAAAAINATELPFFVVTSASDGLALSHVRVHYLESALQELENSGVQFGALSAVEDPLSSQLQATVALTTRSTSSSSLSVAVPSPLRPTSRAYDAAAGLEAEGVITVAGAGSGAGLSASNLKSYAVIDKLDAAAPFGGAALVVLRRQRTFFDRTPAAVAAAAVPDLKSSLLAVSARGRTCFFSLPCMQTILTPLNEAQIALLSASAALHAGASARLQQHLQATAATDAASIAQGLQLGKSVVGGLRSGAASKGVLDASSAAQVTQIAKNTGFLALRCVSVDLLAELREFADATVRGTRFEELGEPVRHPLEAEKVVAAASTAAARAIEAGLRGAQTKPVEVVEQGISCIGGALPAESVAIVAFSPKEVLHACKDGFLVLMDADSGLAATARAHLAGVTAMTKLSQNTSQNSGVVTAGLDGIVRFWEIQYN